MFCSNILRVRGQELSQVRWVQDPAAACPSPEHPSPFALLGSRGPFSAVPVEGAVYIGMAALSSNQNTFNNVRLVMSNHSFHKVR